MRVDQFEQLVVHGLCLRVLSTLQRLGRATMEVILHQVARHAAQRLLHRSHLGDDVRAVAVFFHHFLQAADLPLDAAQALLIRVLQFGVHTRSFPCTGARFASAIGKRRVAVRPRNPADVPGGLCHHDTLHPYIYPLSLSNVKRPRARLSDSVKRHLPIEYATDLTPVVAAKEARASWNAPGWQKPLDFSRRKEYGGMASGRTPGKIVRRVEGQAPRRSTGIRGKSDQPVG